MEALRQWICGVTCAAMIAALCQAIIPKGPAARVGRLAAGLLVALAAMRPFFGLDLEGIGQELRTAGESRQAYVQTLERQNEELWKEVIEQDTAAYILDKAKSQGIDCGAEVTCAAGGDGALYPERVRIVGALTEQQREQISWLLRDELGVPPDRQEFTQEVG